MNEIDIPGVLLRPIERYMDRRGSFAEVMRERDLPSTFVQFNHSVSAKGVLRGLHWHRQQADLWYVVRGRMQVALVDLRARVTPARIATFILDSDDPHSLFIPPGVAHGFLALTDLDLIYWVSTEHDGTDEFGIAWDDPSLAIPWQAEPELLSERDQTNERLSWDRIPELS